MEKTLTVWGLSASIDLYGCNPEHIRSPARIRQFVIELCDLINMKRWGPAIVERLGKNELEGWSLFQFIETSSITGHFEETQNRAFIDIFSCKPFDAQKAADFAKEFFEARGIRVQTLERA